MGVPCFPRTSHRKLLLRLPLLQSGQVLSQFSILFFCVLPAARRPIYCILLFYVQLCFFLLLFLLLSFLFSAVSLVFGLTGSIVFFTLGLTGSVFFLCSSFPSSGTISGTTIFPSSSFAPQLPQNLVASDHSFPHTGHFFILVFLSCPFLSTNLFSLQ